MPGSTDPARMAPDGAGAPGADRLFPRRDAWLRRLGNGVTAVTRRLGGRCPVCRGWCEGGLCVWCTRRYTLARSRCERCAIPLDPPAPAMPDQVADHHCIRCRLTPPPWSRAVTGVDYEHPWHRLLADFKFHGRLDHAGTLLRPLLARLDPTRASAGTAFGSLPGPQGGLRVVPVPVSRERLRERGYNQSWELARRLARHFALEARADALLRLRDTGHQLSLQREARQANLRGAFVVTPRHARWVRGASIALVDDVLTTGATAAAAAGALLAAGAVDVHLWVVARTPDD